METLSLYTVLAGSSVILACIGFYFVSRVWAKWRKMDMDFLRARVFLNKKFLERDWVYIFFSGATLTGHQLIKFLTSSNYIESTWITQASYVLEWLALVFIVILAYDWFVLLYSKR